MATAGQNMNFTRSKEDSGTQSYGVPIGQGNYEIFPRDDQLPQQVQCTQCTPCSTLSVLTHQAVDYKSGKVHFENFNRLKLEISHMKVLPYFDVNAETTLQMDASKKGLFNPEEESHMLCFQGSYQD